MGKKHKAGGRGRREGVFSQPGMPELKTEGVGPNKSIHFRPLVEFDAAILSDQKAFAIWTEL